MMDEVKMSLHKKCSYSDGGTARLKHDDNTHDEGEDSSSLSEDSKWLQGEDPCQENRGTWANRAEFLLAIIGYTVGIGSVWRFPTLCARNGGGAFLVPFFLFMITAGGPLYYLEVCLGQFAGKSAAAAFEFCPMIKGVGLLMLLLSFNVLCYYMTVNAWTLYYFYNSFKAELPWSTCNNWWNTPACNDFTGGSNHGNPQSNLTSSLAGEITSYNTTNTSMASTRLFQQSAAEEFWMYNVLRQSSGIEDLGTIQVHLLIPQIISFTIVVLAIIKGTQSLGKVVYVTATLPYLLLTVLLVRGLTLDGAIDGVIYYVTPSFQKLLNIQVWIDAAVQVFFSLGPTWGGVITMASHNKFHQKSFWETITVVCADCFTAFYCGLVVFSIIGFMSNQSGIPVDEIAKASGHGLAFIAYPTACSTMPFPQVWAALFFLTLFSMALDSDFGMIETISGAFLDWFPRLQKRQYLVSICVGTLIFVFALPTITNGGIFVFTLGDWFLSAYALFVGSIVEAVAIGWLYGAERFKRDVELMTGRDLSVWLRFTWMFFIPILLVGCLVTSILQYSAPMVGTYQYPAWSIGLGFILGVLPIIAMCCTAIWEVLTAKGSFKQRISRLMLPSSSWGPSHKGVRKTYQSYQYPNSFIKRLQSNLRGTKKTPWF